MQVLTIDDLRAMPGRLLGLKDLIVSGFVTGYMAYRRQVSAGLFPPGRKMPSGGLSWEAREIVAWYDALPRREGPRADQKPPPTAPLTAMTSAGRTPHPLD